MLTFIVVTMLFCKLRMVVMQPHDALWRCPSTQQKAPWFVVKRQFTDCGMAVVGCELASVSVCLLVCISCRCRAGNIQIMTSSTHDQKCKSQHCKTMTQAVTGCLNRLHAAAAEEAEEEEDKAEEAKPVPSSAKAARGNSKAASASQAEPAAAGAKKRQASKAKAAPKAKRKVNKATVQAEVEEEEEGSNVDTGEEESGRARKVSQTGKSGIV